MNRRMFFCSLLGLAAVVALPSREAEAAQPFIDPNLEPVDEALADLPAPEAADAQYYGRRPVRRRVVYRRPVRRRVVVYRRPVRRVVYRRPVYYRPVRRVYVRPVVYRRRPVYW